ncbi:lysophosphatidylcholine acyltransferase [Sitodiplosis mosellana]|uniref:lysophosphatidylcholine acyltransferase n=1 Tax=Sitodiplosis mosellana TaxID=263140 RepID=UPI002444382C|nr:lysophosphatidylcholine acyltransferase [Sitodiplosis mosellana]
MTDSHKGNYCLECDANNGDLNDAYKYANDTKQLRDSVIGYAQNGSSIMENEVHHSENRYINSTDTLRMPSLHLTAAATKLTSFDQLTNPFVFKCEMDLFRKIRTAIFTIFVVPCRLLIISSLLLVAWALATIGLWGLTMQDLNVKPISGWRRIIQVLAARAMHGMYFFGSFHHVKITGRQATSKEAPILVLAPHSSFFDSISVVLFGPPSVLAKAETASLPFLGKLINFTQPIYVWREDPNSRQNTIKTVIERANSHDNWPQIIIFPEGTCTNRSCVLSFKPGAFYPGVPVQPVCIRYPNKFDTVTWTWEGPGALKLLWLTMCSVYTRCELEFLPVYLPTEEEKNNPKIYAVNVRNVMAKALGLPTSDLTYDDCKLMIRAKQMNLPHFDDIVEIEKLRRSIGLTLRNIEEQVVTSNLVHETNCVISMPEFALRLQISVDDPLTAELFRIFDTEMCGTIDFREYLLCALYLIKQSLPTMGLIQIVSKMYDNCGKGFNRTTLYSLLRHMTAASIDECVDIFAEIDCDQVGFISLEKLQEYFQSKPELAHLFEIPQTAKKTTRSSTTTAAKPKSQ